MMGVQTEHLIESIAEVVFPHVVGSEQRTRRDTASRDELRRLLSELAQSIVQDSLEP